MTTFDRTNNQSAASLSAMNSFDGRRVAQLENTIDFGATGNAHAAADVFKAIQVPAGFVLLASGAEALLGDTAGNSGTIQMKLGATSLSTAQAPTATGFTANYFGSTGQAPTGTDAYVTVTVGTGIINAVVRVWATLLDIRAKLGSPVVIGTQTNPAGQTAINGVDPVKNYTGTKALTYVK